MSFLPSSPGKTNLPDVFNKYPVRSALLLRLTDDILRGESPFSVAEREMIFAFGSAHNACDFCYDSHKPVAAAFGIDVGSEEARQTGAELLPTIGYLGLAERLASLIDAGG
ncbi:MAG: hypothetical protein OER85_14895 [Gammaproteobacteria bacterium]|nr:hypothetical protein [Gammaproteobacteria bacterium]